jgi:branched-chain amino acid transport system substrate-binding protein
MPHWFIRWRWLALVAIALTAVLAFSACGDDDEPSGDGDGTASATADGDGGGGENVVVIEEGEKIAVGVTAVLSGDLVALGTTVLKAAELTAQQLGDVQGFEVEIISADDTCDAAGAEPAAQQLLANDNLVAVIGSICSGVNVTVQPTYEEAHITQVSSGSTAVNVTDPEGREPFETFLRTVVHDGVQGVKQAEFATDVLEATTAFIAHDTDAYGTGLADVFEENFTASGGEIVGRQGWEKQQTDFASLVTSVTTENPDLVYVASFDPEAAAFLTQLRTGGYEGNYLAGDGVITEQFLTLAGDDAEGAYLSKPAPFEETPELLQFQEDFLEYAGFPWDDQPYAAQTYDAYKVIHTALNEVATVVDGNLEIDLDALNQAIHDVEFDGLSGNISFDDKGDVEAAADKPQILFYIVEGGEYVVQEFN